MKRLENKVAIITGAAGGQGKAEAILFAKHGAKLVITDINEKELKNTEAEILADGGIVTAVKHDVSSEDDWNHVINVVEEKYGQLDILINNAGILD